MCNQSFEVYEIGTKVYIFANNKPFETKIEKFRITARKPFYNNNGIEIEYYVSEEKSEIYTEMNWLKSTKVFDSIEKLEESLTMANI